MKSKLGYLFLILSILVFTVMGTLVYFELQTSTKSDPLVCQKKEIYKFPPSIQVLFAKEQWIVGFDHILKKLIFLKWTQQNTEVIQTVVSDISIQCEKPTYHCLPQDKKVQVRSFDPPYGLIEVTENKSNLYFPFFWDSQNEFKLNSPISFCGSMTNVDQIKLYTLKENILVHDFVKNNFYVYSMKLLNGASIRSASVLPDAVFKLSDIGTLDRTNCQDPRLGKKVLNPYKIFFTNQGLVLYKKEKPVQFYSFVGDFVPVQAQENQFDSIVYGDKHKSVYGLKNNSIYSLQISDQDVLLTEIKNLQSEVMPQFSGLDQNIQFSDSFKKIFYLEHARTFSSDVVSLVSGQNTYRTQKQIEFNLFNHDRNEQWLELSSVDKIIQVIRGKEQSKIVEITCN